MIVALLTAAGKGTRMHTEIPKQFIHIKNKPVILYTMEAFQKHPEVDAILVVSLDSWRDMIWSYAKQYGITKLKWIVEGGATGQESIRCGLEKLAQECALDDIVIIHDGNRPMISDEIISDSLATCRKHGSAIAAIPCIEAIYQSKDGEQATVTFDRKELFRTQTPHSYPLGKLLWAHEQAKINHIEDTTATCTLMTQLGEPIFFSRGSEKNLKLTTREDIEIFLALLRKDLQDELL